jgi:hypothetical protein
MPLRRLSNSCGTEGSLTQAVTKPGRCQVRIYAESPCSRRAEVEILGVAFCGPCARQQEVYFAIGDLTHGEETKGGRGKLLAEALEKIRRERSSGRDSVAAELHYGFSGVRETEPLTLRSS